jgi:hypothetical protein
MLALLFRPLALLPGHSASRQPAAVTARATEPANSAPLRVQAPRSLFTLCIENISSPLCSQQLTHSFSRTQSPNHRPFNNFRTLSHTSKKLTPCLSSTSTLFVRSFAKERKSTPLLSAACGLFRENVGVRQKLGSIIDSQLSLLFPERHGAGDLAEKSSATIITSGIALSLTLAANGVIPLRGSKLTIEGRNNASI